jgi:hypothetical protein
MRVKVSLIWLHGPLGENETLGLLAEVLDPLPLLPVEEAAVKAIMMPKTHRAG